MRSVVCLGLLAISTATLFACSDGVADGGMYASRRASQGVPPPGSNEQHDDSDTTGANDPDPGNPNASTTPNAPSSQGTTSNSLAVSLSNTTPAVDLGKSTDIDVTVTPKEGFTGPVTLSASGLPKGATATFNPATVTAGATPVMSKMTIMVPVTTVASAPNTSSSLVVTATSGAVTTTANASFKVNPKLTLTIPMNINALRAAIGTKYIDQWGTAFGATESPLYTQANNGIVVQVFNADSTTHIVHGANGFAHGDTSNPIQPNAFELTNGSPRLRTLNVGTNCNGYPHEGSNGPSVSFRISVMAPPQ